MPCNLDWQIDKMASRSHKTIKPEHYNIPVATIYRRSRQFISL